MESKYVLCLNRSINTILRNPTYVENIRCSLVDSFLIKDIDRVLNNLEAYGCLYISGSGYIVVHDVGLFNEYFALV